MKITRQQLRSIIKEEKVQLSEVAQFEEDLDYFQDQVEEAYSRLEAETDDVEDILPEHILAKINEALNSLEEVNMAISNFRKTRNI